MSYLLTADGPVATGKILLTADGPTKVGGSDQVEGGDFLTRASLLAADIAPGSTVTEASYYDDYTEGTRYAAPVEYRVTERPFPHPDNWGTALVLDDDLSEEREEVWAIGNGSIRKRTIPLGVNADGSPEQIVLRTARIIVTGSLGTREMPAAYLHAQNRYSRNDQMPQPNVQANGEVLFENTRTLMGADAYQGIGVGPFDVRFRYRVSTSARRLERTDTYEETSGEVLASVDGHTYEAQCFGARPLYHEDGRQLGPNAVTGDHDNAPVFAWATWALRDVALACPVVQAECKLRVSGALPGDIVVQTDPDYYGPGDGLDQIANVGGCQFGYRSSWALMPEVDFDGEHGAEARAMVDDKGNAYVQRAPRAAGHTRLTVLGSQHRRPATGHASAAVIGGDGTYADAATKWLNVRQNECLNQTTKDFAVPVELCDVFRVSIPSSFVVSGQYERTETGDYVQPQTVDGRRLGGQMNRLIFDANLWGNRGHMPAAAGGKGAWGFSEWTAFFQNNGYWCGVGVGHGEAGVGTQLRMHDVGFCGYPGKSILANNHDVEVIRTGACYSGFGLYDHTEYGANGSCEGLTNYGPSGRGGYVISGGTVADFTHLFNVQNPIRNRIGGSIGGNNEPVLEGRLGQDDIATQEDREAFDGNGSVQGKSQTGLRSDGTYGPYAVPNWTVSYCDFRAPGPLGQAATSQLCRSTGPSLNVHGPSPTKPGILVGGGTLISVLSNPGPSWEDCNVSDFEIQLDGPSPRLVNNSNFHGTSRIRNIRLTGTPTGGSKLYWRVLNTDPAVSGDLDARYGPVDARAANYTFGIEIAADTLAGTGGVVERHTWTDHHWPKVNTLVSNTDRGTGHYKRTDLATRLDHVGGTFEMPTSGFDRQSLFFAVSRFQGVTERVTGRVSEGAVEGHALTADDVARGYALLDPGLFWEPWDDSLVSYTESRAGSVAGVSYTNSAGLPFGADPAVDRRSGRVRVDLAASAVAGDTVSVSASVAPLGWMPATP